MKFIDPEALLIATICQLIVMLHTVFIKPRKHLSSHPKAAAWDQTAIAELTRKLTVSGEVMFYEKAQVTFISK
jgi:hypothetical protein